jgi:hypothetical protein
MKFNRSFCWKLTLLFCVFQGGVQAESIYRSIDSDGNITFTNIPMKGAQVYKVTTPRKPTIQPAQKSTPTKQASVPQKTQQKAQQNNSSAPVINTSSVPQSARDGTRRQILLTELNNEQKAFNEANVELSRAEREKNADLIQKMRNLVKDRMRNIDALQSELSRL